MAQPNYILKDEHVATCGHLRSAYQTLNTTKASVAEFQNLSLIVQSLSDNKANEIDVETALENQLILINTKADQTSLLATDVRVATAEANIQTNTTNIAQNTALIQSVTSNLNNNFYNETTIDGLLAQKASQIQVDTLQSDVTSLSGSISATNNNLTTNYNTKTQDAALFKPIDQIDNQIAHSSSNSAITCDSQRYISVKSNGNKICDLFEDEDNNSCAISTYSKRFQVTSDAPQTFSQNSQTALYNFKYAGSADVSTPGLANYAQLQIAPSGITNINPAINITSARINGLGVSGSINLDSSYGSTEVPFVVAPQSLTDAGGTQMIQYRNTATPSLKTQFQGKAGYNAPTAITEQNQFTSKLYVDQAITDVSGGLTQSSADERYLQLTGGTINGDLSLSNNPTQGNHASTKAYVDSLVASTGSSISTAGGYQISTSSTDIQKKKNGTTYTTESENSGIIKEQIATGINVKQQMMTSQSVVNYTHASYGVVNAPGRPKIDLIDVGSEATQCARLSVFQRNASNTGYENENYIQFKPLLNVVETSVPISMITEPDTYESLNLVTKRYVDQEIADNVGQSGVQTSIQSSDSTVVPMTMLAGDGQVSVKQTSGNPAQLQLTGDSITQLSGNALSLTRGAVRLTLTDTAGVQNIGSNAPIIYSGSYSSATDDQVVSQRIADGRYIQKAVGIDENLNANGYLITGLGDGNVNGDAIHYGQLLNLLHSFRFRRSTSVSFYIGDFPLGNNVQLPQGNITVEAGIGATSALHKVSGTSANYFEIRIMHNLNTQLLRVFTEVYSTNTNPSQLTFQNDNSFGQYITNITHISPNEISFWLVYEPNSNDNVIQQNGYLVRLQEYL